MADTIDLPVAGPVNKKWLMIGGAAAAGVVGYAWWKYSQSGGAAAGTDGAAVVEPGFEDYSGGLNFPGTGTTTPGITHTPPALPDVDPDDLPPTTNGRWTQRGVDYLQNLGFDPQLVAVTLGKYLARVPVTQAESDIIRTVEGAIGKPPTGEHRIIIVGAPPTQPPSTQPPPVTEPKPAPAPVPAKPSAPATASIPAGDNVYAWLQQFESVYKIGLTWDRMLALNPGAQKSIRWGPQRDSTGSLIPSFPNGITIKVR